MGLEEGSTNRPVGTLPGAPPYPTGTGDREAAIKGYLPHDHVQLGRPDRVRDASVKAFLADIATPGSCTFDGTGELSLWLVKKREAAGWTFAYLGANQDSYAEGGAIGYSPGSTQNFAPDGAGSRAAFASLATSVSRRRRQIGVPMGGPLTRPGLRRPRPHVGDLPFAPHTAWSAPARALPAVPPRGSAGRRRRSKAAITAPVAIAASASATSVGNPMGAPVAASAPGEAEVAAVAGGVVLVTWMVLLLDRGELP